MKTISKRTRKDPAGIVEEAVKFFGPGGAGMALKERTEGSVSFEGGGGYVDIQTCQVGKEWEANVTTSEWEYWTQRFMEKL